MFLQSINSMIKLFTEDEFISAKGETLLPMKCEYCGKIFYKPKKEIKYAEKHRPTTCRFCSMSCSRSKRGFNTNCAFCGKELKIKHYAYNDSVSKLFFCSHSCSCSYHNAHKVSGFKRSHLESYIEGELSKLYPNIVINYNDRSIIDYELDIFIPKLNIAFELNGIFHYKPIFGNEKLKKIQTIDEAKIVKCKEKKILLYVINISSQKHFTTQSSEVFLNMIKNIIDENLALDK